MTSPQGLRPSRLNLSNHSVESFTCELCVHSYFPLLLILPPDNGAIIVHKAYGTNSINSNIQRKRIVWCTARVWKMSHWARSGADPRAHDASSRSNVRFCE